MDYAVLAEEIRTDPEGFRYAALLPDQPGCVCDLLNAVVRPAVGSVSRADFAMWAAGTGLRAAIQDLSAEQGHPLRSSALVLVDFLRGGVAEALDFSLPGNQALLNAWVEGNALTAENKTALLAISSTKISRAKELGLPPVTEEHIRKALT